MDATAAVDASSAEPSAEPRAPTSSAQPCAHCDLCHAVWVAQAPAVPTLGPGPAEPPAPTAATAAPSAPQRGIFRPPRG